MTGGPVSDDVLLELVAGIYDAATDSSRWQVFLDSFERIYAESKRLVWYEDRDRLDVGVLAASGFPPGAMERYAAHYAPLNPWTAVMLRVPPPHVHTAEMLVPERELVRGEFYADFLRPLGIATGFGACVFREGRRHMFFSVVQPRGQAPGAPDLDLTRRLLPHLQRAAAIHRRFARLQAWLGSLEALLDRLDIAAFLIGEDGRIALANELAVRLVGAADGLSMRAGVLHAYDAREDRALAVAVRKALATAARRASDGGQQLLLTRSSGRRPLSVLVAPVFPGDAARASRLSESRPAAAVLVADPEADRSVAVARMARAYQLTEAEARLLEALVAEGSLPRAAAARGVSHETARGQLKAVFVKTGTNSQVELMRLVLTGAVARETER